MLPGDSVAPMAAPGCPHDVVSIIAGTVVVLTLTVTDNKGLKSSDEMKVTVK
ncbi:MAG: hypothetical protein Q8M09_20465 [Pseudomonadota bacterium]|nr:hypothetical protein [Pseudomonadota bacterium]MDP1572711.1 hypothetical protein [Pseudomonadota bacterium]MDP1906583.1 hypothetical protein [Pseudomonadota bacterium]